MIRINELRLPLNHAKEALRPAALARLKLADAELAGLHIARRGYDARKRSDIQLVYSLDCTLSRGVNEAAVLARFAGDHQIRPTPDTGYHFLAQVGEHTGPRPVVVGFGPCGLFAALILAQMGLRPIVLERGKSRSRAHAGHLGPVARTEAASREQCAVRRGRCRHLLGRQALQPDLRPAPPHAQGADRVRQGRRAGRDPVRQQAPYRHLPPGQHDHQDAGRHRGPGRRDPLPAEDDRSADRGRCRARRAAGVRRADQHDPRRHRAGPQRPRHLPDAACARRADGGQAVFHRLSHRTSAVAGRRSPLRRRRRQRDPRRGRLQAGAPRQERPLGLQLLHVPRRHGGRGHQRRKPRRHQRHEPVLAQ